MKKITKIEYQKKNKERVNIYLDDKYEFGIDLNIMIKYALCKNMELDDEFILDILLAEDKIKAYNYAVFLLSRSSKSEKQLKLKMLDKGYDEEIINNAIERLKSNKYINDDDYSERLIHDKINFSKWGKLKIKEALYNKGIDKQIIDEKLSVISNEDENQRALQLAEKKLKSLMNEEPLKRKIKLSNFLINKGFDYDTVNKVVTKLIKYENDEY